MVIASWIVLILNTLAVLINFINIFTEKTVGKRVASFIGLIISSLTILLCIYVIRMI